MTTALSTEPKKTPSTPAAPPSPEKPPRLNPVRDLVDSFKAMKGVGAAFWACNTIFLLDGAAYFGILNVATLFFGDEMKISDVGAGMYVGILTGAVTIFAAFFGFLADSWGVKRTLQITILASLIGRGLLALAPSITPMEVGFTLPWGWTVMDARALSVDLRLAIPLVLMAFGAGLLQTAVYTGVRQTTNASNQAVGFSLLYALMNGGIVLVSFASSPVRQAYRTVGVLWMCVGITVFYLVVKMVFFPRNAGAPAPHQPSRPTLDGKPRTMGQRIMEHPLANPRFLFFIFILLGVRTLFAHQWLTMPQYIVRAYPPEVGARFEWINNLNPMIIFFGTPFVAALTSKIHVIRMMLVGTFVSAAATFLLVPGPNLWALLTYVTIFSIGEALWSSRFYEYVATIAPADRVGVYMGVSTIPWFLAKTITSSFSGWMLSQFCPEGGPFNTGTMWLIYGFIGMTSPIGLLLAGNWLRRGDMHTQSA